MTFLFMLFYLGEVPAIIEGKVVAGKQTEMSTRESNVKRAIILSALCFMFLFLTINKSAFGGTMPELTIAEQMLYSTVKITTFRGDNSYEGTGFFMDFAVADSGYIPTIITNKHVVQIEDRINIVFHIEEQGRPSGEEFLTCTLDITQNNYFEHPDPMVDLCAITIGSIIAQAKNSGKPVFIRSLGLEFIPKKEDWQSFDAIEDVTMVGYPRGISDNVNNLPVVRRGITATSLGMPYNGKQEFMIDMACFPGSSGSPVFLYNKGIVVDRRNDRPIMGNRFYLVGILYAGPLFTNTGQLILAQPPEVSVQTVYNCNVMGSHTITRGGWM